MAETTRKSVIADIPGLRLAKQIALVRSTQEAPSPAMFGPQNSRLNFRLHNKVRHTLCHTMIQILSAFGILQGLCDMLNVVGASLRSFCAYDKFLNQEQPRATGMSS